MGTSWATPGPRATPAGGTTTTIPRPGVLQARGAARRVRPRSTRPCTRRRDARATWRAVPMEERMAILYRLADLLDAHDDEACAINALDNGTPVSGDALGRATPRRGRATTPAGSTSSTARSCPVAGDALDVVLPEPYGVDRRDRAVERPDDGHGPEGGARAGRRQHRGGEAAGAGAVRRAALRRARARGRAPAGRAQRRRRRCRGGRRAGAPPRHRQGELHRRLRDRPARDGGGGGDAHAAHVRARRQVGQHRVPRRRPRRRHVDGRDARRGAAERAGLRAADAPVRARRRVRRGRRPRRGAGRGGARRRPVRPDRADGPGGERRPRASASSA